jgi:PKD repeat protein
MDKQCRKKAIIAMAALLLFIALTPVTQSTNYICIGECPPPEISNSPPELYSIGNQIISENAKLEFAVKAFDPDGDALTFGTENALPSGAVLNFDDQGNFTFFWIPSFDQSGIYSVNFTVTDDIFLSYENITISVQNVNRPPEIKSIGTQFVPEGSLLEIPITVMDPDDGDLFNIIVTNSPEGGQLLPDSSGDNIYTWTPGYQDAGIYIINFTVMDNGGLIDSEDVTINVTNVNRAPRLEIVGPIEIQENELFFLALNATDPDGDLLTFMATQIPPGAEFDTGLGILQWTPTFTQNGIYLMNISVSDPAGLGDFEVVTINVTNVNRPPVLEPIGNRIVKENTTLELRINATDPDGETLSYVINPLPDGAIFNNTAHVFSWKPRYDQNGTYYANISVTDPENLLDYEIITINVSDSIVAPILYPIGMKFGEEGIMLNFRISGFDPEIENLTYSASFLPDRAIFNITTGEFSWIPDYTQAGKYTINFSVIDGHGLTDSEIVLFNISEPKVLPQNPVNHAPIFNPIQYLDYPEINNVSGYETYLISFTVSAYDFDGNTLIYKLTAYPTGARFDPVSGIFSWTPDYDYIGTYEATFTVTDGKISDKLVVKIDVTPAPQPLNECGQMEGAT